MLGQRILTALGLVAMLALVLIILPRDLAVAALGVLFLVGAWEWALLAGLQGPVTRTAYVASCTAAMVALWHATAESADFERAMLFTMLGWIPLFGWIVLAPQRSA
ncbi:MAG: hypothetical protein ACREQZ_05275, partial [Woeseiaceae bacterium]